jgi:uncharacterized integral membrane protein (TIGR00697 family)
MHHPLSERSVMKILIALAVYITSLVAANTLGLKIMPFLFGTHLSVGVFMFPIVFLGTDIIGEVYGKKMAKYFVLAGIVSTILFIAYNLISLAVPYAAEGLWVKDGYEQIFGISLRISIASVIAYIVGEYQDVFAFFFAKGRFEKYGFWFRSFFSNVWSQAFDTVLFMGIAFYGVYPNEVLLSIMLTWWLFKVVMGLAYTPVAYGLIKVLKDAHPAD